MNDLSEEDIARFSELIIARRKIEAIKLHKEITGVALLDSKIFIDSLEKQLREENPHFPQNIFSSAQLQRPSMGKMPEEDAKKMTEFIFAGQKIAAIKMYKNATGLGLKESKDFIDDLEKQLRAECPDEFAHAARTGCSAVVLLGGLLALAAGAVAWA